MKYIYKYVCLTSLVIILCSCVRKTPKDRAIGLVESKYESSNQKLNFDKAKLDSLYNISPQAYADSLNKGHELDSTLAILETEIEHLPQQESDSVGFVSAELTKRRYKLLDLEKTKPQFTGWKLTGIKIKGVDKEILSFNFNKEITEIVE